MTPYNHATQAPVKIRTASEARAEIERVMKGCDYDYLKKGKK